MKKLMLMLGLMAGIATVGNAQIKLPTGTQDVLKNFIAPPAIGDAGTTASGIADLLGSKLSLAGEQKTNALSAITSFLGEKQSILSLAKTSPADYLKKFNPLQQGLFGKLKTILGAAKFASFLGLKPTKGIATNLLSNLFF